MGYRFDDAPPKPEKFLHKFAVRNGATARFSFGCYYLNGHNPKFHDHIGWPKPDHPDTICQIPYNMRLYPIRHKSVKLTEIHLREEGYDEVAVSYEDAELAEHLQTTAWIDEDDDNIVRMSINTDFPTFVDKPFDIHFTVFVKKSSDSVTDAVCHGILSVLPGAPYPD